MFSTGDHIWYPVAPNSPWDVKLYGLYGIPAVIFMAGYLIRLAIRKRVAYHVSEPNDPSENINSLVSHRLYFLPLRKLNQLAFVLENHLGILT